MHFVDKNEPIRICGERSRSRRDQIWSDISLWTTCEQWATVAQFTILAHLEGNELIRFLAHKVKGQGYGQTKYGHKGHVVCVDGSPSSSLSFNVEYYLPNVVA